jgi:hypothetical protein
MTQALKATHGVIAPPPLDHWIDAVLLLCVRLVHGVATTLGMIFKRTRRDWHTADAGEDLPQAKSDIHLKESNSTHGVILGLVPRISVGTPRGLSVAPLEIRNQDSRHKAENDTVVVARPAQRASFLLNWGGPICVSQIGVGDHLPACELSNRLT